MTPKDKALDLYFKYEKEIRIYRQNGFEYDGRKCKNCCIIAVDEIMKSIGWHDMDESNKDTFWDDVKNEINNL